MNRETLDKANEILKKIESTEITLNYIERRVRDRKQDIEMHKKGLPKWIPYHDWFCKGSIKENGKVALDAPMEWYQSLDFELDEECVDFIIEHEKEKVEKLKKELEEL